MFYTMFVHCVLHIVMYSMYKWKNNITKCNTRWTNIV
jgi:hypothetical protein